MADEWDVSLRHYRLLSRYPGYALQVLRCAEIRPEPHCFMRPGRAAAASFSSEDKDRPPRAAALNAWRAFASTLVLASLLNDSTLDEETHWTVRASGQTFREGVACLRRLMALREFPISANWDLGRFKRITYDVLCQNTSARAERRRENHGGALLLHAGTPTQASRRAPMAGMAFADCIGPDPGHFHRRPLYPNQKCLVVLARCGALSCQDIPGGEEAVLAHLRRLFRRTRRYHDIQGVELALLDHFQLDLSQMESEAKELAQVLLSEIGNVDYQEFGAQLQLLVALLRRKPCDWWQLSLEQLSAMHGVLKLSRRPQLHVEFDAWAHPWKLSREEVMNCIQKCTIKGTSYAQILCSMEHWQFTSCHLGGPSVGLRCAVAWLKTRQGFGKAVALFDHLELWHWEEHLLTFELEALRSLQRLVRCDRRALAAALASLAASARLAQAPRAWAWAAKALTNGTKGPMHWPAWGKLMETPGPEKGTLLSLSVPWKVVKSQDELETSMKVLSSAATIAMDAEWVPSDKKGVAILQLATWEEVHIWDLQELQPHMVLPSLRELLAADSLRKLGFGFATSDWPRLSSMGPLELRRLVDLQRLPDSAQGEGGLKDLVRKTLGRKLDKAEQRSDWSRRPLLESQLQYAALDAHCLLQILRVLKLTEHQLQLMEVQLPNLQQMHQIQQIQLEPPQPTDGVQLVGIELRVGQVQEVQRISTSRHLTCCRINLGSTSKQLIQGGEFLVEHQRVLVICNVFPREIHGQRSEAGLLVARTSGGKAAARPPEAARLGEAVDGERRYPTIDTSALDNPWIRVAKRLSTGKGVVLLDGKPLICAGEACYIHCADGGFFD